MTSSRLRICALLFTLVWAASADAQPWTYFGNRIQSRVRALAVDGDDVYLGGDFRTIDDNDRMAFIARWDGTDFHPLGRGVDARVYGIAVVGDDVYVTGRVTQAINTDESIVEVAKVARWDGQQWHAMGDGLGGPNTTVGHAMTAGGGMVYVGGDIDSTGTTPLANIAQWDIAAETWSAMGDGFEDVVRALAYDEEEEVLYAGGSFGSDDAHQFDHIAEWDGSSWTDMGDGQLDTVRDIVIDGEAVFVSGGSSAVPVLSLWVGTDWTDLSSGFDDRIDALFVSDDALIASGDFTMAGGVDAERLAVNFDPVWAPLGSGLDDRAIVMKQYNDDLLIGGEFVVANSDTSRSFIIYTPAEDTALEEDELPAAFALHGNHPNPFNPVTTIRYTLETPGPVTLVVADLLGRRVATLVSAETAAGEHSARFDARHLPSGTYLYTLRKDGREITRSMVLAK